jgi:hypothetical protein
MDENTLPETDAGEVTPAAPSPADQVVDAWFNEMFHNSLVSRDPQIFNYCQAAKEELKRRLAAL